MGNNTHSASTYTVSVSKGCKEGIRVGRKQALNVCETFDLELLRLFLDDFSDEEKRESVGLLLVKQLSIIVLEQNASGEQPVVHEVICTAVVHLQYLKLCSCLSFAVFRSTHDSIYFTAGTINRRW